MPSLHRDTIVKEERMPQEHRKYLYYNADSFIEGATKVAPNTLKVWIGYSTMLITLILKEKNSMRERHGLANNPDR